MLQFRKFAIRSQRRHRTPEVNFYNSIDDAVKSQDGEPTEVFEVEYKSLGYFKAKETYEKCDPPPQAAPPKKIRQEDKIEDDFAMPADDGGQEDEDVMDSI